MMTGKSGLDEMTAKVKQELYVLQREDETLELRAAERADTQLMVMNSLARCLEALFRCEAELNRTILRDDQPVAEPLQMVGNVYNDEYFGLYPRRQLPRLPISPHFEAVLAAERTRRFAIEEARNAIAVCRDNGLSAQDIAEAKLLRPLLDQLSIIRLERHTAKARERSWFTHSVQQQLQQHEDFTHLENSGVIDTSQLRALERCGVKMIFCPSDGAVPPTFVSESSVTVGNFNELVKHIRQRDRLKLSDNAFLEHQSLIEMGTVPQCSPITADETYEAELLAELRDRRWASAGRRIDPWRLSEPLRLPRCAAEKLCEQLGCRLATVAIAANLRRGMENDEVGCGSVKAAFPNEPLDFKPIDDLFLSPYYELEHKEGLQRQRALWNDLVRTDKHQFLGLEEVSDHLNPDAALPTPFALRMTVNEGLWLADAIGDLPKSFRLVWSHRFETQR